MTTASAASTATDNPWLYPVARPTPHLTHRRFHSREAGAECGYALYLPTGYDTDTTRRFPAIYWLHGLGGSPVSVEAFAARLDAAIRAGRMPATLVVAPQGLPQSFYCDDRAGRFPVERVILNDLLPHVDATWRVIPDRAARAIEGFSMGGWGAARLGCGRPDLFGRVSLMAAALHTEATFTARRGDLMETLFGGDRTYWQACSPWHVITAHADAMRGRQRIRLWIGAMDTGRVELNAAFSRHLTNLAIAHEFTIIPGVAHEFAPLYDRAAADPFAFFGDAP